MVSSKKMIILNSKIFQFIKSGLNLSISSAQILSKVVFFIIFALITKRFSKIEYSKLVLVFAILNTIIEVGNSGLLQGVTKVASKYRDHQNKQRIINFTFLIMSLFISTVINILFFFITKYSFTQVKFNFGFSVFVYLSVFYSLLNTLFVAYGNNRHYFFSVAFNSLILLFSFLFFYFFEEIIPIKHLIYCYIFSFLFSIFYQLYFFRRSISIRLHLFTLIEVYSFGKWFLLWAIFSVLDNKIELILLSKLSDINQLAIYDVSLKFLQPIQLFLNSTITTVLPLAIFAGNDINLLQNFRSKRRQKILFLLILNFLFLPPALTFIKFYYNGEYNLSMLPLIVLVFSMVFMILNLKASSEIYRMNMPKIIFVIGVISAFIKLIFLYLLIGTYGAIGAALSLFFSQLFSYLIFSFYTRKVLLKSS